MEAVVSRALMISLSLHPARASEISGLQQDACSTTVAPRLCPCRSAFRVFTEIPFAAMITSIADSDENESQNPFKLLEAGD
jgi:hypothetical protein